MYRGIDAHIHLDKYEPAERQPMLDLAFESGIAAVIAVSMDERSCEETRRLAQLNSGRVHPAYGFHPEQPLPDEASFERLFGWIRARHLAGEAFAIGEVGLPYYSRTECEEKGEPFDEAPYVALLDRFAALAAELDRPLVLHAVYEDGAKACEIAARHGVRRVHFHWFKGDKETIATMIERGYRISVTPDVAYEIEIQQLVRDYPLELMMIETDGPWPFEAEFAGRRTEPVMALESIARIAALKQQDPEVAARILLRNTAEFYGIELMDR
ncbi:TatD family hydrolase [Paenibacillus sp. NEAU-GSW1]|uniref:TatD family hydrolase n=1 Tax=Paenibacillus sp. NEAU-GSW1 TaxID=2682486 RepID=UPI0012E2F386|nr:TatD family hydrolase [Paenibacillus sp. NEAU-GSW1]MUT66300.1 TatD family deoxyribonuclease [Paenibacillus sp. NEAU-GSW1]